MLTFQTQGVVRIYVLSSQWLDLAKIRFTNVYDSTHVKLGLITFAEDILYSKRVITLATRAPGVGAFTVVAKVGLCICGGATPPLP